MSLFPLLSEMEIRYGGKESLWEGPVWGSWVGEWGMYRRKDIGGGELEKST